MALCPAPEKGPQAILSPVLPLAGDDFALLPLLVHLFSRAPVDVQEESPQQAGDEDAAGFTRSRQRLAR